MSKMLARIDKLRPQPNLHPAKADQLIPREEQFSVQFTLVVLANELGEELGEEGIEWQSSRPSHKAGLGLYGVIRQ